MKSMTGYGYAEIDVIKGVSVCVEIKSVNRKQLDIKINLPIELSEYEIIIRKFISERVSRGSVSIYLRIHFDESAQKNAITINSEILKNYLKISKELSKKLKIPNKSSINDFFNLPKVIDMSTECLYKKAGLDDAKVLKSLDSAFLKFDKSREEEGKYLKSHFELKISELTKILSKIESFSCNLQEIYMAKIRDRLNSFNVSLPDENVLARELVLYSDKCDITEELTRLKSHFISFKKLVKTEESVGRNIDFLIQEIQREINTLGVKAAGVESTPLVVLFKTELEKIREQIQNIE